MSSMSLNTESALTPTPQEKKNECIMSSRTPMGNTCTFPTLSNNKENKEPNLIQRNDKRQFSVSLKLLLVAENGSNCFSKHGHF